MPGAAQRARTSTIIPPRERVRAGSYKARCDGQDPIGRGRPVLGPTRQNQDPPAQGPATTIRGRVLGVWRLKGYGHGARNQQSHPHRQSRGRSRRPRSMPSGMTVTNIRIATSESWKDKQSGEQKERTEWHTRRAVRPPGRDRRRIPAQGLAGLHRGLAPHPQVAGQGRQRPLHHRDHRQRHADARRPRRRRRRWRSGGSSRRAPAATSRASAPRPSRRPAASGGEAFDDDIPF